MTETGKRIYKNAVITGTGAYGHVIYSLIKIR